MDTAKNFFDAWVNTQAKLVDGLVETSKKMQESFGNNDAMEKSVAIYQEWANKQKDIAETIISQIKGGTNNNTEKNPYETFKTWMEEQVKFGKHLLEFMQENASVPLESDGLNKIYQEWSNIYQQNFAQFGQNFTFPQGNVSKETFSGFVNNTRSYLKMFELWQSIYKFIQSANQTWDNLSEWLDMNKYQEVLTNIFQFKTPEHLNMMFEQMQKYTQSAGNFTQGLPFSNWNFEKMMYNPFQNLEHLSTINGQFSAHFYKVANPYFIMTPAGREKELAIVASKLQEKYIRYYLKTIELQQLIYFSGQKSLEKSIKELSEQFSQNNQMITFDDFYAVWVNATEQGLIGLFNQDKFSQLQAEMVKAGLEVKANLDKQMEIILSPLPIVPRSEVDDLNATIYELKQRVRDLETTLQQPTQANQQEVEQEVEKVAVAEVNSTQEQLEDNNSASTEEKVVKKPSSRKKSTKTT